MRAASILVVAFLAFAAAVADAAEPHSLEDFLKRDQYGALALSPDGRHYAVEVPHGDRTNLAIIRRSDRTVTGYANLGKDRHVHAFHWVNNERVLIESAEKLGSLDQPLLTGEIYAINADGSGSGLLFGYRADGTQLGTRHDRGRQEEAWGFLIDTIPGDDRNVLIAVWPWTQSEPYTRAERMDVYSGKRQVVARAPVQRARFLADLSGVVRFAVGEGVDNVTKTYYRSGERAEWELINDEAATGRVVVPVGFAADGRTAYLQLEQATGPDAVHAFDMQTRESVPALRGEFADPHAYLRDPVDRSLVGAVFMEGRPRLRFFDEQGAAARLYKSLQAAFPGQLVTLGEATRDGAQVLLSVRSDRSPGDYYVFDLNEKKADLALVRRDWIDPARTAAMEPVVIRARDGRSLHGYLTLPPGGGRQGLPLIVNPHGGPFGIADVWGFDEETQLLAAHGYAVLQVNFRGSGNYGREHVRAGFQQWGRAMQDDVTDATRWAIGEGIADPSRICIYGASYGGYAALMGTAREPELYRCAAGYVGVYDMPLMYRRGDIALRRSGRNYLEQALGRQDLEAVSPTRLADRIQAPVFLAAGGEDKRAPLDHTQAMERALKRAGKPVETLVFRTEGHGFYVESNRREYYGKLIDFFERHIGRGAAAAAGAGGERAAAQGEAAALESAD